MTANLEYNTEFAGEGAILFSPADYDGVVTSDGYWFCADASANGDLRDLTPGTIIRQYHDNALVGKFYLKNIERIGKTVFKVNAISAIGLLDMQQHLGGLYDGTTTFATLVADIVGNAIPYTIEADVATIPIFGWLPIATARENLHKLMFAEGVSMTKDTDGDIVFSFLYSSATPPTVPSSRIYLGGNIDYSTPATAAEITEHYYYDSGADESVTLFDNSNAVDAADHLLVPFSDAPVHDVTATGLTINESGVNYAIVTGKGTLTGQKYTHNTSIVRKDVSGATGAANVVSVTDDCLVGVRNSQNVARRVLAYYSSKKRIGAGILLNGERAGRQIAFPDPYGDSATGYIQSMEITATTLLKGDAQIITDYTPTGQGNNYSNYIVLTGSGNWTIPDNVTECRAEIFGGGDGGTSGTDGDYGWCSIEGAIRRGTGAGGTRGLGGSAGKHLTVTLENLTPGTQIAYACGVGGASDGAGTDTTFGTYSSANGSIPLNGVINLFTGEILAVSGSNGMNGGLGASTSFRPSIQYNGNVWIAGEQGYGATIPGGSGVEGGYGGGAAVGHNGQNGWNGGIIYDPQTGYQGNAGDGGDGADADDGEDAATYGSGGNGGHGGGGGGRGGDSHVWYMRSGYGGLKGKGSKGGKGGDGCVIIYY